MSLRWAAQRALQPVYLNVSRLILQPVVQQLQQRVCEAAEAPAPATRWARAAAAAALGLGVGASTAACAAAADASPQVPPDHEAWAMLSLDQRRRQFFKYEKRVRELSPPEKVFEYFASGGDARGGFVMSAGDIMRSVVPVYPPLGSDIVRSGRLPGEPNPHVPHEDSQFLNNFDLDASGGFTFDEWLLFQALLSVPQDDVQVAFALMDHDGNGEVDAEEFSVLLEGLAARAARRTPSLRHAPGALRKGTSGLVATFFKGRHGRLSLQTFEKFIADLRTEVVRLEFSYYDFRKQGSITGRAFAHSVVGCARIKHIDDYLDRVDALPPHLAAARVSPAEFAAFRGVWRRLRRLAVALEFWAASSGALSRADFQSVASRVMGATLAPPLVDVLFHLFANDDGSLNAGFMVAVMDRGFETGLSVSERAKAGPASFLECMAKCGSR